MNEGLIPRRYAKALYEVARDRGQDKNLYGLMDTLEQTVDNAPQLAETLANPFVADADKQQLLSTAAGAGGNDATFSDFLKLLAQNRRLDMAPAIARAYTKLYREQANILRVHVTGATPLDATQQQRLRETIEKQLQGASMEYSYSVDPSLIGGFTIAVGNRQLDASVSHKLQQMRQALIK